MRVAEARNIGDLVMALETLRQERLNGRRSFEEIWWNNLSLVAGDHYMRWEPTLGMYVEREVDDHNVRLVVNHARVVARTELGKLMKSVPVTDVMPKSEDGEDIAAARVGVFALDAAEWKWSLRKVRKSAKWWMILCGTSAVYTGWNPEDDKDGRQNYMIDPATNEPVFNPMRERQLRELYQDGEIDELIEEDEPLGDLEFRVYSPFQLLPDDSVLEFEDCGDIITTDVVQIDKAQAAWRPREELHPDENQPGVMEARIIRRLGQGIGQGMAVGAKDTVQVHTFWLKPGVYTHNEYLKDGIMVRWANHHNVLEENKPYPYAHGNLPFAFFEHIPNATSIWSDSVLEDVRGPNLELDKTLSQLLENRDYMTNPMWLIAEQTQISGDKIKSRPGGEVRYVHVRDVPPPEQIAGVPLPVQVENLAVALRDQILDLSGQGEVSRGRVPSGVRAGIQMQYLQDEDETKLGPTADNCGEATARMGSQILSLMGQFYHHERILRLYKRGGSYDVRKFKGADLKGNTDVVYLVGSAHSKSKAARQQNMVTMIELGIPVSPKKVNDIFELGVGEPEEIDLAMSQADRENELMIRGVLTKPQMESKQATTPPELQGEQSLADEREPGPVAVPVKNWHNHQAHLERHRRFMMDEEFERLSVDHPDIVRLFDEHVTAHEQALQQIVQAQMEQAMAMRGMPDGPAGSPAPAKREAPSAPSAAGGGGY